MAVTTAAQASTTKILNTIRAGLPSADRDKLNVIKGYDDLRQVGKALEANPGLSNDYLSAMINRITRVVVQSLTFENRFKVLKQGIVETGDTVEQVFVNLIKALEYDPDKVGEREFKRTLPDARAAFHTINWRVVYPLTLAQREVARAFQSFEGVQSMMERLINVIYTSAEYDELLLYKYMLIKAITSGKVKPLGLDSTDPKALARVVRATTTRLQYPTNEYNEAGVNNATAPANSVLIIDADTQATLDVDVLAMAFNIDKADVMQRVIVLDDWETFDRDRFSNIAEKSTDQVMEPVTDEELGIMEGVRGVLVDVDWFQVYDLPIEARQTTFGSTLETNFWLHVWKIVSHSPFHNIAVLTDDGNISHVPDEFIATVKSVSNAGPVTVVSLDVESRLGIGGSGTHFVQDEAALDAKVGVDENGIVYFAEGATGVKLVASVEGVKYTSGTALAPTAKVGDKVTFTRA